MTVLDPTALERLRTYAAADLDDPTTRRNVQNLLLEMLPDLVDTVEYWQSLGMENLDGIDLTSTWPLCRCERDLTCAACEHTPDECDCSSITDEIAAGDELTDEDLEHLDPLTRTLMGYPSGIRCGVTGRRA